MLVPLYGAPNVDVLAKVGDTAMPRSPAAASPVRTGPASPTVLGSAAHRAPMPSS